MIQVKLLGGYRFQLIEEEFNAWARETNPFIIKTILDSSPIPRPESGHSLFFTMAVFFDVNKSGRIPEEIVR